MKLLKAIGVTDVVRSMMVYVYHSKVLLGVQIQQYRTVQSKEVSKKTKNIS